MLYQGPGSTCRKVCKIKKKMKIKYINKEIFEKISAVSEISLHSLFDHSLNLRAGDILINVSANSDILPPYGLVLEKEDFDCFQRSLKESFHLAREEGGLWMGDAWFSLDHVQVYESQLAPLVQKIRGEHVDALVSQVQASKKENGWDLDFELLIQLFKRKKAGFNPSDLEKKLLLLADEILEKPAKEEGLSLEYFLGRGRGLTPAGDDFLVGLMAMFSAHQANPEFLKKLQKRLLEKPDYYTNEISQQFLLEGTRGRFSQSVHRLIQMLSQDPYDKEIVEGVLGYGGTSGVDILVGILYAYYLLNIGE